MVFENGKYLGPVIRFEHWFGTPGIDVVFYLNGWGYSTATATHYEDITIVCPD